MKKITVMALSAVCASALHAAAVDAMTNTPNVAMTSLKATQRYPWNGKVDIDFSFQCSNPDAFAFINFKAEYVNAAGETVEIRMKTFDQFKTAFATNAGTYRVTWDSTADAPNLLVTNLKYTVTANMAKYMVEDLSKGTAATADDPYPITYMEECPDPTRDDGGWTDEYKTTKMVFRLIQPGTDNLGWSNNAFGDWNSGGYREVTITKPFYLSIFECTQGQAKLINGSYPGDAKDEFSGTTKDKRPVSALKYAGWRGASTDGYCWPITGSKVNPASIIGLLRARTGNNEGFDIPTEAEWEYAARAGEDDAWGGDELEMGGKPSPEPGPTGSLTNTVLAARGRYQFNGGLEPNEDGTYSKPDRNSDDYGTAVVGSYKPNAWGLYDCLGNAYECTLDHRNGGPDKSQKVDPIGKTPDPAVVAKGEVARSVRGGLYNLAAKICSFPHRASGSDSAELGCRIAWRFPFAGIEVADEGGADDEEQAGEQGQ